MALSVKRDGLKHVPWFSLAEWHEVYKEIYSNDTNEQTKAYERLLVWKSRLSKLPVGVECTISIMQVCLRDRELTPKIESGELPPYHENDLCLMYSTTIMRFLNHITNIGQTKQSSLFQIARQLKIPEWIVNIRHDAAHGHELPSISVLRIATNILLEWLHEEYWAAETKAMEEEETVKEIEDESEPEESRNLTNSIELWISIGLYIHAGYTLIREIPDAEFREKMNDLRSHVLSLVNDENEDGAIIELGKERSGNYLDFSSDEDCKLVVGQKVLLSEISRCLSKNKTSGSREDLILNVLFEGGVFLPSKEFLQIFRDPETLDSDSLPSSLTSFWQEFVTLLHEKEMLGKLILRLLNLVKNDSANDHRRLIASLWMKHIASGLCKIKLSQQIKHGMQQARENKKKKISSSTLSSKVRDKVDRSFPQFKDISWFHVLGEIPGFLTDLDSVERIISTQNNKLSKHFVPSLLELVTPNLSDDVKDSLLSFMRIYTNEEIAVECENSSGEEVKTVEDFVSLFENQNTEIMDKIFHKNDKKIEIGDQTVRNTAWNIPKTDDNNSFEWGNCPFGILPWQLESMETVDTYSTTKSLNSDKGFKEFDIVPGAVDAKSLNTRSKINWNSILGKKKRSKSKKNCENIHNMVDKAIKIVKEHY